MTSPYAAGVADAPRPLVSVEPVESRAQLRRFAEVPYALHHTDPRWTHGVRTFEQWRIDARRHPYFDRGDAAYLLARRGGRPLGRIAAHVDGSGDGRGWFGFFDVPDDRTVTTALLDAATEWLRQQGATSMTGPVSWTPDEEFGVLVSGHEHAGVTGCPWQPAWYAEQLRAAGGRGGERQRFHRLSTEADLVPGQGAPPPVAEEPPPHAGGYADPTLVLDGIAAVPDVAELLAGASLRGAWRVARAARHRHFETAVCVRCEGDPAVLVPGLLTVAATEGYRWLLAPWAPDDRAPERVRQVFRFEW